MHFYVPETNGYRISGSYKLYPQHCSLPTFNDEEHAKEVSKELVASLKKLSKSSKNKKKILETLKATIDAARAPLQRVAAKIKRVAAPIQRVDKPTENPHVTTSNNPTAKRRIQARKFSNNRKTRNNVPGKVPPITNAKALNEYQHITREEYEASMEPPPPPNVTQDDIPQPPAPRRSRRQQKPQQAEAATVATPKTTTPRHRSPRLRSHNIISQEAVNFITHQEYFGTANKDFTPPKMQQSYPPAPDIEHFAAPVIHPTTGETVTSYKKLAKDPVTSDIWTKAFGK